MTPFDGQTLYLAMRFIPWAEMVEKPLDGIGYAPLYASREEAESENPGAEIILIRLDEKWIAA